MTQARLAARSGIRLDTVLRRYFAGYTLLADFLVEEARAVAALRAAELREVQRGQALLFDRLIALVTDEHERESRNGVVSGGQRRLECARGLLEGELLDGSELGYELDRWHLGAVAAGVGAERAFDGFGSAIGCDRMSIRAGPETAWAWIATRKRPRAAELAPLAAAAGPRATIGLGEPAEGLAGWRLTHRQAAAALAVALRAPGSCARYADVALLAAVLQDEVLETSLRELYLMPLERSRDRGKAARETLRAYFAADRNVSSAAAALGVSRRTVANRLRAIEQDYVRKMRGQ